MRVDNKPDEKVLSIIKAGCTKEFFLKNLKRCDIRDEQKDVYDIYVSADLDIDDYIDRFRHRSVNPVSPEKAAEMAWNRLESILQRKGQVNMHGVYITGYESVPVYTRSKKPLAWQEDYATVVLCLDSFTELWMGAGGIMLPSECGSGLNYFSTHLDNVQFANKRLAIDEGLRQINLKLQNTRSGSKQDEAVIKRFPKEMQTFLNRLNLGVYT